MTKLSHIIITIVAVAAFEKNRAMQDVFTYTLSLISLVVLVTVTTRYLSYCFDHYFDGKRQYDVYMLYVVYFFHAYLFQNVLYIVYLHIRLKHITCRNL